MAPQLRAQNPAPAKSDTNWVQVYLHGAGPTAPTKADTTEIRKLAAADGLDTTKAKLRIVGDTAWIEKASRLDPSYLVGNQLLRVKGRWYILKHYETRATTPFVPLVDCSKSL